MLHNALLIVHVLLSVSIIALVLLQRGKGADAGAGFGAGASGTVFGARGSATFFSKLTAVLATTFFVTSLALAMFASRAPTAPKSLVEQLPPQSAPAPVLPTAPPGIGNDDVPQPAAPAPAGQ
jgi:preprotein translocase subunit SecG